MMGMGWNGGGLGMLVGLPMLLWWGVVIFAIAVFARWVAAKASRGEQGERNCAVALVRKRHAGGETGEEKFDGRKRDLA